MSGRLPVFTQLVEQLDKHLRVINQAAHEPYPEALEDVTREVGQKGDALVKIWKLLWPAIEKNELWREVVRDRISRREPWAAGHFPQMIGDILLADSTLMAEVNKLLSPEAQAEVSDDAKGNESTLIASGVPTGIPSDQVSTAPATLVLPEPGPWTSGGLLQGRFRLARQLAHGGFGETWLAEDIAETSPRACVVKKFIFQHHDANLLAEIRRRFEREAQVLERLGKDHDQIPSFYAFSAEGEEGYFVQEYVEGPNLAEFVRDVGIITEPQLLDFLDSILTVLSYVHINRVIHRDIKPANIILRKADGKPTLIDFGALKEIATTVLDGFGHATTTLAIGTQGYTPIEQIQGRPCLSSDIYALGFTALFLISGKKPQELINIATGDVEWSDLDSVLSPELRNILSTAIAQMVNNRYRTAEQMQKEIRQLIQIQEHRGAASSDNQAEADLLSSRERLKQLRASDEVQLPKLARAPIEDATRKLYDSLRAAIRAESFAFDENQPAMVTHDGFPASNMILSIYDPDEPGIVARGHHSITVRNKQFVATYIIGGDPPREYFEGPIVDPALLDDAIAKIVPKITSALINHYMEQVSRGKKLTINDKWEFYKDQHGDWRWRRIASNGRIISVSYESYRNRSDCEAGARRDGWPR